jgi:hypothetical protein
MFLLSPSLCIYPPGEVALTDCLLFVVLSCSPPPPLFRGSWTRVWVGIRWAERSMRRAPPTPLSRSPPLSATGSCCSPAAMDSSVRLSLWYVCDPLPLRSSFFLLF